jgi:hypothetical protein
MKRHPNSLSLRRQSIRTLTVTELSAAHGGRGGNTGNGNTQTGTCIPTRTTNRTK